MKVYILPYIEQTNLYNAVNMSSIYTSASMWTVAVTRINTFLCPSDANEPSPSITVNGATAPVGPTSYPNNIGTFIGNNNGSLDGPAFAFATPSGNTYGPIVSFASVTDGLSNTAIWSEWVKGKYQTIRSGSTSRSR